MVLAGDFRGNLLYTKKSTNIVESTNYPLPSVPLSIPSPTFKKFPYTPKSSVFAILSTSPIVEGIEMHKTPEDKKIHTTNNRNIKTQGTRCISQAPWTSQPMPKISPDIKRTYDDTFPTRIGFFKRCLLKLRRTFKKAPEPLQLDGPFISPVKGCNCGKCEQEFYVNKYVGYGINVYGICSCSVVPPYCSDFAVVFYC